MANKPSESCHELVRLIGELICYEDFREDFFDSDSFEEALAMLQSTREYKLNSRQQNIVKKWFDASQSPNVAENAFATTQFVVTQVAAVRSVCPSWPCD